MVDSNDRERFQEAYDELMGILESPEMNGVPVVVLANKQDLPNAVSCSQIAQALHLHKMTDRYGSSPHPYRAQFTQANNELRDRAARLIA